MINAKSSVGFHLPRSFVAFTECEWFLFFLFFRPGAFDAPGLLVRLLHLSDWETFVETWIGLGAFCCGTADSIGVVEIETVLDLEADFVLVAGGCKLNVVSTSSSSNFLRFIVREELKVQIQLI